MAMQSVSFVKAHLAEVIESARSTGEPLLITQNGAGAAVLQDVESYDRTRRALALMKLIAMGEHDVQAGRIIPQDEVFRALRSKLAPPTTRSRKSTKR